VPRGWPELDRLVDFMRFDVPELLQRSTFTIGAHIDTTKLPEIVEFVTSNYTGHAMEEISFVVRKAL
jgi:hypothetical protein